MSLLLRYKLWLGMILWLWCGLRFALLTGKFFELFFSSPSVVESPLSLLLFRLPDMSIASDCSAG